MTHPPLTAAECAEIAAELREAAERHDGLAAAWLAVERKLLSRVANLPLHIAESYRVRVAAGDREAAVHVARAARARALAARLDPERPSSPAVVTTREAIAP